MVEMSGDRRTSCTAMTERSLVVLDEIGRGTSTFDGISIAWAVAEAMVRAPREDAVRDALPRARGARGRARQRRQLLGGGEALRGRGVFLYRRRARRGEPQLRHRGRASRGRPRGGDRAGPGVARALRRSGEAESASRQRWTTQPVRGSRRAAARQEQLPRAFRARVAAIHPESLTPLEALNLLRRLVEEAQEAAIIAVGVRPGGTGGGGGRRWRCGSRDRQKAFAGRRSACSRSLPRAGAAGAAGVRDSAGIDPSAASTRIVVEVDGQFRYRSPRQRGLAVAVLRRHRERASTQTEAAHATGFGPAA